MSYFQAQGISIHFGGVKAVDQVSFDVDEGTVCAIVGPNGAGKTTIFNLISRIYDPTEGRLIFDGRDITGIAPHKIASLGIARTFQNIELFEHATVLHNLLVGRHRHRRSGLIEEVFFPSSMKRKEVAAREKVEEVIDFLDLQHYRDQMITQLPYGVRKVVELGRALCSEPRLLLLDEPASGLNVEETEDMAFWIEDIKKDLGVTVIMVEHDMSLVSDVSDKVIALTDGRVIAEGTSKEVQSDPEVVRAYLGA